MRVLWSWQPRSQPFLDYVLSTGLTLNWDVRLGLSNCADLPSAPDRGAEQTPLLGSVR
jgi:hypothetical protein